MQPLVTEALIFQDQHVTVTTARAVLGGVTYALANITSVRSFRQGRPFVLIPGAALFVFAGGSCLSFVSAAKLGDGFAESTGIAQVVIGLLMLVIFIGAKPKYWVRIGTAGGESNAVFSYDPTWTARVVGSINEAIVRRG